MTHIKAILKEVLRTGETAGKPEHIKSLLDKDVPLLHIRSICAKVRAGTQGEGVDGFLDRHARMITELDVSGYKTERKRDKRVAVADKATASEKIE